MQGKEGPQGRAGEATLLEGTRSTNDGDQRAGEQMFQIYFESMVYRDTNTYPMIHLPPWYTESQRHWEPWNYLLRYLGSYPST